MKKIFTIVEGENLDLYIILVHEGVLKESGKNTNEK